MEDSTMSIDISPENEQFIQHVIETGVFHNRGQVINEAFDLLKKREQLRRDVDLGIEQIQRGDYAPLDMEAVKAKLARRLDEEERINC